MRIRFVLGFAILLTVACGNSAQVKSINSPEKELSIKENASDTLISGRYNNLSIALNGNHVTGVYEYYNGWNDKAKEYSQVNIFYFNGVFTNNTASIKTAWPTSDQKITGKLVASRLDNRNALNLTLDETPDGYADVDFTQAGGVLCIQNNAKNWIEIRLVKENKTKLFTKPDSSFIKKGYLVKNDIVKVISSDVNGWYNVEYSVPNDTVHSNYYWIRKEALLSIDLAEWK